MGINGVKGELLVNRCARFLNILAIGAVAIAMLLTTVDALLRYIFSAPIPGGYHLIEFLLVAIIAFPLAIGQIEKAHIRVDMLISRIHGKTLIIIELLTIFLALLLFVLATYTTAQEAWRSLSRGDYAPGLIHYPIWPSKAFIPLGTGCFSLRLMVDVVHHVQELFGRRTH